MNTPLICPKCEKLTRAPLAAAANAVPICDNCKTALPLHDGRSTVGNDAAPDVFGIFESLEVIDPGSVYALNSGVHSNHRIDKKEVHMKSSALVIFGLGFIGNFALAANAPAKSDGTKTPPPFSAEQRQKMADQHEKMAACLRSDRPFSECREEMMKGCKAMGGESCPMMGGKEHHGKHHPATNERDSDKE